MHEPVPGYRSTYLDVTAPRSCLVAVYLDSISNSRNLIPYSNPLLGSPPISFFFFLNRLLSIICMSFLGTSTTGFPHLESKIFLPHTTCQHIRDPSHLPIPCKIFSPCKDPSPSFPLASARKRESFEITDSSSIPSDNDTSPPFLLRALDSLQITEVLVKGISKSCFRP